MSFTALKMASGSEFPMPTVALGAWVTCSSMRSSPLPLLTLTTPTFSVWMTTLSSSWVPSYVNSKAFFIWICSLEEKYRPASSTSNPSDRKLPFILALPSDSWPFLYWSVTMEMVA